MGRPEIPEEIKLARGARFIAAREALEPTLSQRAMAVALGLPSYRHCEKSGADPGQEVLEAAYGRLESVKRRGLDASDIAAHIRTGRGTPPWNGLATRRRDTSLGEGNPVIRMVEAELEGEVTDANARLVIERVRSILSSAKKAGLIAIQGAFLVVAAASAEAGEASDHDAGMLSFSTSKQGNVLVFGFVLGLRGSSPRSRIFVVLLADSTCKPVRLAMAV